MLLIHGVFAVTCVVMPMLNVFRPGMPGGGSMGTIILEFRRGYFTPVRILAYLFFRK